MYINDKTKASFYEYICRFENEISSEFGQYNINSIHLRQYLDSSSIFIAKLNKTNKKETKKYKQFVLFDDTKPASKKLRHINNDSAHNLLRHIRNSMAHGNIDKKSKGSNIYILKDYKQGGAISMEGILRINCLEPIINLLIASKI